ncbi:uncharacterized protein DUF3237 [Panacagrimonas perspica]|uniref:Uncharacterized protein DUF3237 n=1 Tax=Panacagrimonas perspica TaxID=381431 RepID=A0A4V3URE8_9GAMM|nr:DUF3237 domain-containing protein [Panacagrimonas perspica]TDU31228.1 uncharacterized protein DUF3237 [Panacagrimonas perspica]THD02581.1 hypothetical protein B1810_13585 [Panacagrimonas perspica]
MDKPPLESRWLATLSIAIDPPTAVGPDLLLINVVEARLDGPRIKAKVIPPSGDWVRVQPGGNWNLDVRLAFLTDDGEAIFCKYSGVLRMDPGLGERLAAGESVPGSEIYLRAAPCFETRSDKYAWLNDMLAVGKITGFGGGKVSYDIYEIL